MLFQESPARVSLNVFGPVKLLTAGKVSNFSAAQLHMDIQMVVGESVFKND